MTENNSKERKALLIGVFVKKDKAEKLLERLHRQFNLESGKIHIYEIEGNKEEYLISFKTYDKDKYMKVLHSATVLHVKNGSLFSINALNHLIGEIYGNDADPLQCNIDWSNYKDKLIIVNNGVLTLSQLFRKEKL